MSREELRMKRNVRQCRRCRFSASASVDGGVVCDYIGITGHMRGCDTYPKCEKFEVKARKRVTGGKYKMNAIKKKKTELTDVDIEIIRRFSNNNMNIAKTAREAHMTATSVRYHLERILDKTGVNPREPQGLSQLIKKVEGK